MIYPTKEINNWLKNGVFCLINDSDKKVDVRYSSDCNKSIALILSEINQGIFNIPDLAKDYRDDKVQIKFLEEIVGNELDSKVAQCKWYDWYIDQGYSTYRTKPSVKLKVVVDVESYGMKHWIVVKLRNSHFKKFCVGVFDNMNQTNEFINQYYKNNKVERVVYCENTATKLYRDSVRNKPEENPLKNIYEQK